MGGSGGSQDVIGRHLQWLRDRGLAPYYIGVRGRCLKRLEYIAGKPLLAIDETDLRRWRAGLCQGPDWIRCQVTHVREFYRWAVRERLRRSDPSERLASPRAPRRLPRPIGEERLRMAIATAPHDVRLMLALAAGLGLRACELAGLRWESVRLDAGQLVVAWETAKGQRERVLPLASPWLRAELDRYGTRPTGWVFARRDGQHGPNRAYTISHIANHYLRSAGIPDTLHSLRHRFATELLAAGANMRVVQELLGHASPATTAIYTRVGAQLGGCGGGRSPGAGRSRSSSAVMCRRSCRR